MQAPDPQIYHRTQWSLVTLSLGVVFLFLTQKVFGFEFAKALGEVSFPALGASVAHLLYSASYYVPFQQKEPAKATGISFGFVAISSVLMLLGIGSLKVGVYLFWLILVTSAGLFGLPVLMLMCLGLLGVVGYILANGVAMGSSVVTEALLGILGLAAAGLSLFRWKGILPERHDTPAPTLASTTSSTPQINAVAPVAAPHGNNQMAALASKLNLEQLKADIILRSIGDGVVVVDNNRVIKLMNNNAVVLTNWREDEAVGIQGDMVLLLSDAEDNDFAEGQNPIHKAILTQQSVVADDVTLKTRANKNIDISMIVSPIISEAGEMGGVVCVFRDISEIKRAARQRDEFISTASHEMRTPVAAIEGYMALAMNEKVSKIDANARKYLDKAHGEVKHLGNLFRDLLSVTKLEEGKIPNRPQIIELHDLSLLVIDELRFKVEEKGLKINMRNGNEIISATSIKPLLQSYVDPERIREAITNLVTNAVKFTEQGEISISLKADKDTITVGVQDSGMGISPEDQRHLFQKFYRIDNSKTREIGGTGLGLYIVRTLVEMYGGRIWVESVVGQGSNFLFTLPRLSDVQIKEIQKKEAALQLATQEPAM